MKNRKYLVASLVIVLALAGCATDEAARTPADETDAARTGAAADRAAPGAPLSDRERQRRAELLAQKRVHFAFDSSTIDSEARAIIEAHASHLVANTQLRITIEGHCDERGTREYNLALGERRAQSVERMMRALGVAGNRIKTVSFGEEKPLCLEHNESCWRQNRRAELQY